jgi:hypothetical protein
LAWLLEHAPVGSVYRSAERVVLILDLAEGDAPPEPPGELLDRAPHGWRFTRVR